MADAPAVIAAVDGVINPGALGQLRTAVVDVVWTSDGANKTAGHAVAADVVGLATILGATFLGDAGLAHAGTDTVGTLDVALTASGATATVTGLSAAGVALDLDNTDIAAARVLFVGI